VLRRLSREKDARLATASSVVMAPDWYAERLFSAYGEARGRAILAMHLHEAPIDLTVKSNPEEWAARLGGFVLPTGSVRLDDFSGSVAALDGYDQGAWWVQDAAASIPARLFGAIEGLSVADLCAAPGGKTAQLAMQGAVVTAFDQSANRLKRLETNLARLKFDVACVHADFMTLAPEGRFDAVLLDAPCSSTGTVRRHPDVPWTKSPQDIAKLAALQGRMLRHALSLVKPGGVVVFSNCSLDPAEGEDLVAEVLAEMPDVARRPVDPVHWPGLEAAITAEGDVRTTPEMLPAAAPRQAGLDGFFASVLTRSA
jgi:16S rRNA (cytosine967-C5)-methyltransferase